MYLVDTNVISELRKGDRCDPNVVAWYSGTPDDRLFTSVLVVGEIQRGIDIARRSDPQRAAALGNWLEEIVTAFSHRVLPVDSEVAQVWGNMSVVRTVPVIDCLLAATAQAHGMILVTRNTSDVEGLGAEVLNPFAPADLG